MKDPERYLKSAIQNDAMHDGKISLITGPRQVGKTTLTKSLARSSENYLSYDEESFRRAWNKDPIAAIANVTPGPIVLDEIHKDRYWKRKLKGLYDKNPQAGPYLVTGSARLDLYRRGSDSLLGRYIPYRMHPFSVGERSESPKPDDLFSRDGQVQFSVSDLLRLGGFPEPLLSGSEQKATRWSRLRRDRLVQEDTRDLLNVSDLSAFGSLVELLPERVGSVLSLNALREDVGKAYATVRAWYHVLEALYFSFTVRPYSKKVARAIRSEPKLYLFDLLNIPKTEHAKRLENLTALHLLKACHFWTDTAQGDFSLQTVRDKSKREVDFLIVRDGAPWALIECKSGDKHPSKNLLFFSELLKPVHRIQLVDDPTYEREFAVHNVRVLGYERFFAQLP